MLHHFGFSSEDVHRLPTACGAGPTPAELRPGIVHRLDVGTTGVIAVAKTDARRTQETDLGTMVWLKIKVSPCPWKYCISNWIKMVVETLS